MERDRFVGSLLGLALGDALGAPHEGSFVEKAVWRFLGGKGKGQLRWTDDTQMTLDIADWLLESRDQNPDALATRFAASYRWDRGYGPGAAKILKRIARGENWRYVNRAVFPDGSWGNGAGMRVAPVGLFFARDREKLVEVARATATITHAHPVGIEGALFVSSAVAGAVRGVPPRKLLADAAALCQREEFTGRAAQALAWIDTDATPEPAAVVESLGNGLAAHEACVTAVYLALRFVERPFHELVQFAIRCGGDVDTIAAMGGAVWGAARGVGALSQDALASLEARDRIEKTAVALHERATAA